MNEIWSYLVIVNNRRIAVVSSLIIIYCEILLNLWHYRSDQRHPQWQFQMLYNNVRGDDEEILA